VKAEIIEMGFADSKIEAVLLLSVAIAINLTFFYGLITRPIIVYHLSTTLDYNGEINFNSEELLVDLEATNEGLSPARVAMIVRSYNMSLRGPEGVEASEEGTFSELYIPLDEPIHRSVREIFSITLNTDVNATYLVLIFSVQPKPRVDPIRGFYDSFAIYKPERPNALLLRHVDNGRFTRVTSR
jgi:hypothetical protein